MKRWTSFTVVVVTTSLVAAAWLMLTDNKEHMLEILVYTLVLFCPLLHLFHTRHRH
jgi:hypothetical protein